MNKIKVKTHRQNKKDLKVVRVQALFRSSGSFKIFTQNYNRSIVSQGGIGCNNANTHSTIYIKK